MTTITGNDAIKFVRQVRHGRPNARAREALIRGNELLEQYRLYGYARITIKDHVNRSKHTQR